VPSKEPAIVRLAEAATTFRRSLSDPLRAQLSFCLADEELFSWSNLPLFLAPRRGVRFAQLSPQQLDGAYAMFDAFLSAAGSRRAHLVIDTLEESLRREHGDDFGRGLYHVSMFNDPASDAAWGVQLDGHHLAITFIVDGDRVSMTPAFFGADPGTVAGVKVFEPEESLAYDFVAALSTEHLRQALVAAEAPEDVLTQPGGDGPDAARSYDFASFHGVGLAASEMTPGEQRLLRALIAQVVSYQDAPWAARSTAEIEAVLADTYFAWMGPVVAGDRFYFRIASDRIVIEYDLTEIDHAHLIVRTPRDGDYAGFAARVPTLQEHYRTAPHHHGARAADAAVIRDLHPDAPQVRRLAHRLGSLLGLGAMNASRPSASN
jgi:uncharacterized protein DUF3500